MHRPLPIPMTATLSHVRLSDCSWQREINHSQLSARCMTYVEAFSIPRAMLFELLAEFPDTLKLVRKAALKVAFRRTLVRLANQARTLYATLGSDEKRDFEIIEMLKKEDSEQPAKSHGVPEEELEEKVSADSAVSADLRSEIAVLREGLDRLLVAQGLRPLPRAAARLPRKAPLLARKPAAQRTPPKVPALAAPQMRKAPIAGAPEGGS